MQKQSLKDKEIKLMREVSEELVSDYIRGTLYELRDCVLEMIAGNSDEYHADKISEEEFSKNVIQNFILLDIVGSYILGLADVRHGLNGDDEAETFEITRREHAGRERDN